MYLRDPWHFATLGACIVIITSRSVTVQYEVSGRWIELQQFYFLFSAISTHFALNMYQLIHSVTTECDFHIYVFFHRFVTDKYHSINRDITIIETVHSISCPLQKEILEIYQNLATIILECIDKYIETYCQIYIKIYQLIYIYTCLSWHVSKICQT